MSQLLENIEEFISIIQSNPALYNYSLDTFNNKELTQKLWEEIACKFNTNVGFCKSKWGVLRVSFVRQIRNERTNAETTSEFLINDWYLKDNMSFMRNFMRKRKKCKSGQKDIENNLNNDSLSKSNIEIKTEHNLSNESLEIKNEPIFVDENDESLDLICNEEVNSRISDVVSIASSSVSNSRQNADENQIKDAFDTCAESNSRKKRRVSEQTEGIPADREDEPALKRNANQMEDLSLFHPTKDQASDITKIQRDATLSFFNSILPDINKLSGRRQRMFKQKLWEKLNMLLDEQENES